MRSLSKAHECEIAIKEFQAGAKNILGGGIKLLMPEN